MHTRIISVLIVVIALLIAVIIAVQIGQGEFQTVYITTLLIIGIPIVLALGLRSWYTLPFAMLAELPAIPLVAGRSVNLAELCVTMFSALMVFAVVQRRYRVQIKIRDWWPMLLYGGWIFLIAVLNGGGFAILGSASIGGRRYLTVGIAVVGMVMLSQMTIRDKEARRVCWLISLALAASGAHLAVRAFLGWDVHEAEGYAFSFYSWQQGLSFVSLGGVLFIFARFKPSQVITKPFLAALYLLLLLLAAYSGKRMGFAACCVIPVVACLWHRQGIVALAGSFLGVVGVGTAVMVQNQVTSIPRAAQRVLAFIPADWDWEVEQSTVNTFRETLNRWAWKYATDNPIIGKGVTLTPTDYQLMQDQAYVASIRYPDDDVQAFPHIAGKNWHSTWLGLAASFGFPGAVFWIFVQLFVLIRSWRLGRDPNLTGWSYTLVGMIFFFMVLGVLVSWSSGDVAKLAMAGGLCLGVLSAVKNGLREEQSVHVVAAVPAMPVRSSIAS